MYCAVTVFYNNYVKQTVCKMDYKSLANILPGVILSANAGLQIRWEYVNFLY